MDRIVSTSARLRVACAALALAAVTLAAPASATVPDPNQSEIPEVFTGRPTGNPNTSSTLLIRDAGGVALAGATVHIDFSTSGHRLYSVQNPGTTVDCVTQQMITTTNGIGEATVSLRFAGCSPAHSIDVVVDGVILGRSAGRSTDIDQLEGKVGLPDVRIFAAGYFAWALEGAPFPRCLDFGNSGCPLCAFNILGQDYVSGFVGTYCP